MNSGGFFSEISNGTYFGTSWQSLFVNSRNHMKLAGLTFGRKKFSIYIITNFINFKHSM